jgi:gas vesicle protein
MLSEMKEKDGMAIKMFIGGLALGAIVGGTIAILYAPAKGEDTRRMIGDKAMEAEKMIQDKAIAAEKMIEQKSAEIRAAANQVISNVKDSAMDAKKRGENVLDCIKQA